jgi:hypothetical protein
VKGYDAKHVIHPPFLQAKVSKKTTVISVSSGYTKQYQSVAEHVKKVGSIRDWWMWS